MPVATNPAAVRIARRPGPSAALTRRRHRLRRPRRRATPRELAALSLGALGVVFGDIGTSPLYAFRECFNPAHGLAPAPDAVLGVLSLIVWALVLVVSIKYLVVLMRLDNRGEGGILALLALLIGLRRRGGAARVVVGALGLFGAALLYGDGLITPAISVLSAAEGLEVATPVFTPWVLPATVTILVALFALQRRGTEGVGAIFGPIMLAWFVTIAALGAPQIAAAPAVLRALDPWHGIRLLADHGTVGVFVLGAVVLAVTGAEALYADMGHFGQRPIRLVWFGLVLPALLLNYFGQGALVLVSPEAVTNPFYRLAPGALLYPLVALATLATVVASQALISGAFSLTQQAILLRFCPRLRVIHTSRAQAGQIYVPVVNVSLMVGCLLLVVGFRSSSALGAAYGIAVTGTMLITTVLFGVLARERWGWSAWRTGTAVGGFLLIDLAFLGANVVKITHGGWVPLAVAGALFTLMTTWKTGNTLVHAVVDRMAIPLGDFIEQVRRERPPRVPGVAVFLAPNIEGAPLVLQHHLRHTRALHSTVILLSIVTEEVPDVEWGHRIEHTALPEGFHRVRAHYGFMETPRVPAVVRLCCRLGEADARAATYYIERLHLVPTGTVPMARWRKHLFVFMARNSSSMPDFLRLPPDRVVELGAVIEL